MEDTFQALTKPSNFNRNYKRNLSGDDDAAAEGEECDDELWETLSNSFRQVQSILEQNRALIQQVNENHQSKIHDNLVKNVALIQEINHNVSKAMSLYSDLSVSFSNIVHQRQAIVVSDNHHHRNINSENKVESAET